MLRCGWHIKFSLKLLFSAMSYPKHITFESELYICARPTTAREVPSDAQAASDIGCSGEPPQGAFASLAFFLEEKTSTSPLLQTAMRGAPSAPSNGQIAIAWGALLRSHFRNMFNVIVEAITRGTLSSDLPVTLILMTLEGALPF